MKERASRFGPHLAFSSDRHLFNVCPFFSPSDESDSGCSSGFLSLLFLDIHLDKMTSGCDLLLSRYLCAYMLLPSWQNRFSFLKISMIEFKRNFSNCVLRCTSLVWND